MAENGHCLQNSEKFMNIKLLKTCCLLFVICKPYNPEMRVSTPFLILLSMGLSGPLEDIQQGWAPLCGRLS